MKLSRAAIAFYIALVFVSGVVLGAVAHNFYVVSTAPKRPPGPEEVRKRITAEYQRRLKLTDDQLAKLNIIMDETRARIEETRREMHPAYQKIHEEQQKKFRDLLTPGQQAEFDQMLKEREQRSRQGGRGGRGPGGPGI
jgi:Spy/CpxP family protein refolding chaperone